MPPSPDSLKGSWDTLANSSYVLAFQYFLECYTKLLDELMISGTLK